MRINQFVAQATGMSRRAADLAIGEGQVLINGASASLGTTVGDSDVVTYHNSTLHLPEQATTIILNKPVGYVCSRDGQGSQTVYNLLPEKFHGLKPVGRLDKDSSGLLLLTNDGALAHELTHPSKQKEKVYEIELGKELRDQDREAIEQGIQLEDGISALKLEGRGTRWTITMSEGRNRQIRRTFKKLDYQVTRLHRTKFGTYSLQGTVEGKYKISA